jgi:hypothetical protein
VSSDIEPRESFWSRLGRHEMPASYGQQAFAVTTGVAGGVAGLWIAKRLADSTRVKTRGVILASGVVIVATLAVVMLIEEASE